MVSVFWCRWGLNPRSLIQPSETLPVELVGIHFFLFFLYEHKGTLFALGSNFVLLAHHVCNAHLDFNWSFKVEDKKARWKDSTSTLIFEPELYNSSTLKCITVILFLTRQGNLRFLFWLHFRAHCYDWHIIQSQNKGYGVYQKKEEIKVMDDMFGKKKKTRRCLIGLSILRK